MSYAYTPDGSTVLTAITFPDAGDTGAAGAAAASVGLEGCADLAAAAAIRVGKWLVQGASGSSEIANSASATYPGAVDFVLYSGGWASVVGETLFVSMTVHVAAPAGPAAGEFRIAYQIDSGTITELTGAYASFDSLGTGIVPVSLQGHHTFTAGEAGALTIYLQCRSPGGSVAIKAYQPWSAEYRQVGVMET